MYSHGLWLLNLPTRIFTSSPVSSPGKAPGLWVSIVSLLSSPPTHSPHKRELTHWQQPAVFLHLTLVPLPCSPEIPKTPEIPTMAFHSNLCPGNPKALVIFVCGGFGLTLDHSIPCPLYHHGINVLTALKHASLGEPNHVPKSAN